MVNFLIVDDNMNYAISLMNYINKNNSNIRVCNIAVNGKNAIELLNSPQENIDIILLDLKLPLYDGIEILQKIKYKEKYKESFIIISGELNLANKIYKNEMIYTILNKLYTLEEITEKIEELVKIKDEDNLKEKIINELLYLNYDISNIGTIYLIEVIKYIILKKPNKESNNLTKEIYPIIAKRYKDTVHNIKSNIERASNRMYYHCEMNKLQKYFNYNEDMKPNVKTIITTIINKII